MPSGNLAIALNLLAEWMCNHAFDPLQLNRRAIGTLAHVPEIASEPRCHRLAQTCLSRKLSRLTRIRLSALHENDARRSGKSTNGRVAVNNSADKMPAEINEHKLRRTVRRISLLPPLRERPVNSLTLSEPNLESHDMQVAISLRRVISEWQRVINDLIYTGVIAIRFWILFFEHWLPKASNDRIA